MPNCKPQNSFAWSQSPFLSSKLPLFLGPTRDIKTWKTMCIKLMNKADFTCTQKPRAKRTQIAVHEIDRTLPWTWWASFLSLKTWLSFVFASVFLLSLFFLGYNVHLMVCVSAQTLGTLYLQQKNSAPTGPSWFLALSLQHPNPKKQSSKRTFRSSQNGKQIQEHRWTGIIERAIRRIKLYNSFSDVFA